MDWLDTIICWFFKHDDEPFDIHTPYLDNVGWFDTTYSWKCRRCGRVRE